MRLLDYIAFRYMDCIENRHLDIQVAVFPYLSISSSNGQAKTNTPPTIVIVGVGFAWLSFGGPSYGEGEHSRLPCVLGLIVIPAGVSRPGYNPVSGGRRPARTE